MLKTIVSIALITLLSGVLVTENSDQDEWRCKDCVETYWWFPCKDVGKRCRKGLRVLKFFPERKLYLYNPKSTNWKECWSPSHE